MKKFLAVIVVIFVIPASSYAFPMIYAGAQQVQFGFEFRDSDDWHVQFGYGRFVTDELLLGAFFTYSDDNGSTWAMGANLEHHFHIGTMTHPYLSGTVIYEDYGSGNHIRFGPAAGINHFLTDYLSVDLRVRYLFSSDGRDEELEFLGGLRIFF